MGPYLTSARWSNFAYSRWSILAIEMVTLPSITENPRRLILGNPVSGIPSSRKGVLGGVDEARPTASNKSRPVTQAISRRGTYQPPPKTLLEILNCPLTNL